MGIFDNIWFWLLVVAIVLLIIFAPTVLTTLWGWVSSAWGFLVELGLPWWGWALIALGLAYVIDPEGTTQFIHDVVEWIGDTVGSVVGAVASGLFSSPLGTIAIIGLAIWGIPKLLGKKRADDEATSASDSNPGTSEPAAVSFSPPAEPDAPRSSFIAPVDRTRGSSLLRKSYVTPKVIT